MMAASSGYGRIARILPDTETYITPTCAEERRIERLQRPVEIGKED